MKTSLVMGIGMVLGAGLLGGCYSQRPPDTSSRALNEMQVARHAIVARVDDRDSRIGALERENQRLRNEATARDRELARFNGLLDQGKIDLANAERGLVKSLRPEIEKGNISVDLQNNQLLISLAATMLFDSGEDKLDVAGVDVLKRVGNVLKEYPQYPVQVAGHTDNVVIQGTLARKFPSNIELSKARATSAAHALVEGGVRSAHLDVEGFSDTKPVATNLTEEGRNKNRRVEVLVTRNSR